MTTNPAKVWTLKTIHDRCDEEGDCWLWKHAVNSTGYPQGCIDGKPGQLVRRHAVLLSGRSLSGYRARVADTCGNRLCCNPDHLKLRTFGQVQSDSYTSGKRSTASEYLGRVLRAQSAGMVKLDFTKAREIRSELAGGKTVAQISLERGLYPTTVRDIKFNRSWRDPMFMAVAVKEAA
jgi:hypothetical protein